jgi:hypothetical protein
MLHTSQWYRRKSGLKIHIYWGQYSAVLGLDSFSAMQTIQLLSCGKNRMLKLKITIQSRL